MTPATPQPPATPLTPAMPMPETRHFEPALFDTVLVANRGEIACRVIDTLRRLGIRSVAVFSDADRGARHVALADVAVRIGPAEARHSYLDIDAILRAATETGAQAIHPGYGFLSENEEFARATLEAGITFIGPGVHALHVMGDKIRAKKHVAASGVPTVPGISQPRLTNAELAAAATGVGFPLLIKPSAGGGGKGMYVVDTADDLATSLEAARRVAARAFGDDTLLLERLIRTPRHIEVQVLADDHGHVIHLGERECSLQRRHQKVIEEAPSPLLDEATRQRMGEAACSAARGVDYRGAGTVEFLVSADEPDSFYFLEMNTRLQVEHPVTELVTGLDLVEWQVRIAAGERLSISQDMVRLSGHAVEARVYAETPAADFLPATGTVLALAEPRGEGIRVDSSLKPGLVLTADYDPMLAKVIAWGADRREALARLDRALAETVVLGLDTNIAFLRQLVADPLVRAGDLDTGLIGRMLPTLPFGPPDDALLVAAALFLRDSEWQASGPHAGGIWTRPTGWRLGEPQPTCYRLTTLSVGGETVEVRVSGTPDAALVSVDAGPRVSAGLVSLPGRPHAFTVVVEGVARTVTLVHAPAQSGGSELWAGHDGGAWHIRREAQGHPDAGGEAGDASGQSEGRPELRSPMPGTVVSVGAATGDRVSAGDTLLTIEAMKMEHPLVAELAGIVTLSVTVGEPVGRGQLVATVHSPDPARDRLDPMPHPLDAPHDATDDTTHDATQDPTDSATLDPLDTTPGGTR